MKNDSFFDRIQDINCIISIAIKFLIQWISLIKGLSFFQSITLDSCNSSKKSKIVFKVLVFENKIKPPIFLKFDIKINYLMLMKQCLDFLRYDAIGRGGGQQ